MQLKWTTLILLVAVSACYDPVESGTADTTKAPDDDATALADGLDDAGETQPPADGTTLPEVTPDTATPDTSTPDSSTPDSSTPDTSTPDTSTSDTSSPDTSAPDTASEPDADADTATSSDSELTCSEGTANCDGNASNGCESSLATTDNCGACAVHCTFDHATAACEAGGCVIAACDTGYDDCDGESDNGCETTLDSFSDCGACGATCELAHASTSCADQSCVVASCVVGYDDCDGSDANGCEAPLTTVTDCGACGEPCAAANATTTCATGTCAIAACTEGYGNCDGNAGNGCETRTNTLSHCGGCGVACGYANGTASCATGICEGLSCSAGFSDCDGEADNGCEADFNSLENCGACDHTCGVGSNCVAGKCEWIRAIDVSVGEYHACTVLQDGSVQCWGSNGYGQLGDGLLANGGAATSAMPVVVLGIRDAVEVAAGSNFNCALRANGQVLCWGSNAYGVLGNGTQTNSGLPVTVLGLTDAIQIAVGSSHACALRSNHTIACWGVNDSGQLGNGSMVNSLTPVQVVNLTDATMVAVGSTSGQGHSCAVRTNGHVACWGTNGRGELGTGNGPNASSPVEVSNLTNTTAIAATSDATCVIRNNGAVACWGYWQNHWTNTSLPVAVNGTGTATSISGASSYLSTCVLRDEGTIACWGANHRGQFGIGTTVGTSSPNSVGAVTGAALWDGRALNGVTKLGVGSYTICVIREAGEVWCAGHGSALGDGQVTYGQDRFYFYPVRSRAPLAFEDGNCGDDLDNDGDGATDCADVDCATNAGSTLGLGAILDSLDGRTAVNYQSSCGGVATTGREKRHRWRAPSAGTYEIATTGSSFDTILSIEETACGAMLDCNDDAQGLTNGASRVVVTLSAGQEIGIVVDSKNQGSNTSYQVTINRM